MAITHPKDVQGGQSLNIGSEDVLVLVHLPWVVRMKSHTRCKSELSDAVLAFFVLVLCLFNLFFHAVSQRGSPT